MILNIPEGRNQTLWISTRNGICNVIPEQKENGITLSVIDYDEINNLQNPVSVRALKNTEGNDKTGYAEVDVITKKAFEDGEKTFCVVFLFLLSVS